MLHVLQLLASVLLVQDASLDRGPQMLSAPFPIPNEFIEVVCDTPKDAKSAGLWLSLFPNNQAPILVAIALTYLYNDCKVVHDNAMGDSFVEGFGGFSDSRLDVRSYHAENGIRYYAVPTYDINI